MAVIDLLIEEAERVPESEAEYEAYLQLEAGQMIGNRFFPCGKCPQPDYCDHDQSCMIDEERGT
jgi:hypothetical protein